MTPASLPRRADRIERRFSGPVSIGIRVELWFYQRFQMPFDHHLGNAIRDRGNSQRARLAIALRYVDPPHRRRKVAAGRQTIPKFIEVALTISLKVRNRLPVYASRPLVSSDLLIGFPHLPFRNVVRLCPIHEDPPVAGCPHARAEQRNPFAPTPLQGLHHYYGLLRPCAPHRYSHPHRVRLFG